MAKQPLHDILCGILNEFFQDGNRRCYFSPPADILMSYPCMVYNYANDLNAFADNQSYQSYKRYSITVIDQNPDSKIPSEVKKLPYCTLDRVFSFDGLNHFVYVLYYNGPRVKEEENEESNA